jgi:hypothetical protein
MGYWDHFDSWKNMPLPWLEWLLHFETCEGHDPTQRLQFPLQPDLITPPPLIRLHHYLFVCQGVYG